MLKRVKNWFTEPAGIENDQTAKNKDVSEYLDVDRGNKNVRYSGARSHHSVADYSAPTAEWYVGPASKTQPQRDRFRDSTGFDETDIGLSDSASKNPTAVSYRSLKTDSEPTPAKTTKKPKKKVKPFIRSIHEVEPALPNKARTETMSAAIGKSKQVQGVGNKTRDSLDTKQSQSEHKIARMRTIQGVYSKQVIVTEENVLPSKGPLSVKNVKKMHKNKEKFINMDKYAKRQLYKCGENFVINEQIPSWKESSKKLVVDQILDHQYKGLSKENLYKPDGRLNDKVALWYGDITRLEIDVVVNATSSLLLDVVVGVNKAIREAAGSELDLDLESQWELQSGSVFKTCGYHLPARWIYHVSGPYGFGLEAENYLSECYKNALKLMKEDKQRTIAFPCIAAGSKGVPYDVSADVALRTVRNWLEENQEHVDRIIFSIYESDTWNHYVRKMQLIFPAAEVESDRTKASKLPVEILRMDNKSIELYKKALEEGKEKDYSIRIMITGPFRVGKSTFTKRLLYQDVDISERNSTDGIDVHVKKCKVSLETSKWIVDHTDTKIDNTVRRLAKILESSSLNDEENTVGFDEVDAPTGTVEELEENIGEENTSVMPEDKTASEHNGDTDEEANKSRVPDTGDSDSVDDLGDAGVNNRLKHEELLMKDLKEVILDASKPVDREDYANISVWDFGGQFVFYTTHQMFLSHRAIYILINNMSQHIGDVVIDDEPYFDCSGAKSLKIEGISVKEIFKNWQKSTQLQSQTLKPRQSTILSDFIDIWLNSIHGHSKSEQPGLPPVILVGTHADKLNPETRQEQIEAIFDAIRNRFVGNPVSLHFIDKDFGLSNATEDPRLAELRQTIMDVAREQPYWGEEKPAKWIPLEKLLAELRRKGVEIMSHSEIEQLNENLPVPIVGEEELELFLRFQHETANIMYFSVPELQNKIVLSPQFLVNALKSLITAEMFCKKKSEILDKWKEFRQKGILRTSLLDAVWNREENCQFRENREHILALMEYLNIVARPVLYTEDEESGMDTEMQNDRYYLVPCMLRESPPPSVFHCDGEFISTPCLCLVLENVAFPSAIFNRLLVGCMACWPVAKSGKKYHIYCGCGQFDVDVQHRLTLSFHSNIIGLRITRFSHANRHPSTSICSNIHTNIKKIFERISKCLSLELKFDEYIQCPHSQGDSMACIHSMEKLRSCDEFPCHEHDHVTILHSHDLLKYWYDTEEKDYNNSSNECVHPSVLTPSTAFRVPTEKELVKISHGIGLEFQQLFLELGITNARLGQIRASNPYSVADQVIQLLLEWRRQRGCLATFRELETAMKSVGSDTVIAFKDIH